MAPSESERETRGHSRLLGRLGHFRRNKDGFTAVEFAMVAGPFLMMLFGIINVGLLYFTTFTIENATESAGRFIRTGQAATWDKAAFKTQVCNKVPSYVDCLNKLRVDVRTVAEGVTPSIPSGTKPDGTLTDDTSTSYSKGCGGSIVLVTTFYQWDLAKSLPFLKVGTMADGSRMIRAATVFKNEPYTC